MTSKSFEGLIEKIGKMSVLELSDFVKALQDKFGVSADMPMVAGGATSAVESDTTVQEEKTAYKVTLEQAGSEKIKNIKALRQVVANLSLTDAKKAVEDTPTVLADSVSKEEAENIKKILEEVGAKVVIS